MHKKFIHSLSLAIAGCALSVNAWALTPADGQPDLALYIPGSQANDPAFGFLVNGLTVANAVCQTNAATNGGATGNTSTMTTHIYFQNGINDNYSAIYCYTDDKLIPGLSTGDQNNHHKSKLWISRRRLGASFVGLDAIDHGTLLTYLADPVTANCTAGDGAYSSGGAKYQYNYSCTTATSNIKASAATSDVTPDVFYAADNVTPGSTPITASTINNIHALGGHIVGIPVTLVLRNALQYAEIQSGLLPSSCTVGAETASCVPSLTKEQLVSIFTGAINDWSQLQITSTQTLVDITAAGVTAKVAGLANPRDTTVHLCRRENGAGQQVAVLANILQYPCLGSAAPEIAQPTTALSDVEYATSLGAVDKCLGDFNDGTSNWFGTSNPAPYPNPPVAATPHGNQWALSIQSTERNATNGANYRFIAIDGAVATGQEAYLGHYRLVGNYALSWNSGSNSADQNAALAAIAAYSKLPTTIASRNGALSNQASFGQAGYIALSDNGFTPPAVWTSSNPVSPFSRVDTGGKPNACVIPTVNTNYGQIQLQ